MRVSSAWITALLHTTQSCIASNVSVLWITFMGMSVNSPVMYLCGLRNEIHWSTSEIDALTKVKEAPQRNYTTTKHKGHCYWTSIMPRITTATQLFLSANTSLGRHRAGINLAYLSKVSNYLVYLINRTRRILKWFCKIQRGLISYSLKKQITGRIPYFTL